MKCSDSGLLYYNYGCVSDCPEGYVEIIPGRCGLCTDSNMFFYDNGCVITCPDGYGETSPGRCGLCTGPTPLYYNHTCVSSCPESYVEINPKRCVRCSDSNMMYYNRSCISSCPAKTVSIYNLYLIQYECKPCYLGCETCVNTTSSGCLSCSEGFFYFENSCNTGCPSDMYANAITRVCEQCQPPCVTCSKPNNHSCTSCPPGYFVFNGTCVANCPYDHYQTLYSVEDDLYQVPICSPKLVLTFDLSLTTDSRVISINFNYGIVSMILAIAQRIQVQIANTQIDEALFVLSPLTESKIKLHYLGDQYYPPLSLLQVTIDLDTTDFNTNSYQQFRIIDKTATIQLKEIYPFSQVETQFISSTSDITEAGGSTVATIQAVSSIAQGGVSTSLVRLQIIGEVIQLLRFIAIRWPPNVAEYFTNSDLDPSSIMMPVDFMGWLNDPLDDRNYSMPRVFEEYETPPFFTQNYNIDVSNLLIWVIVVCGGSVLLFLLQKGLKKVNSKVALPNKNHRKKKWRYRFILILQKLSQLLNKVEYLTLWNFLLSFILSMFQSGCLWSLLNMRYNSALLESPTTSSRISLAIGILFFLFYLALFGLITWILLKNMKYLVQTEGTQENPEQEERLQKYGILFDDFHRNKRMQILFLPISLIKSLLFVAVIALMAFSPVAQITLVWVLSTAFIVYFVVYQPLKVRWMRRMTFLIELLSYGCVTIAFILGVVDKAVELDATTLDEIGFVFLILTISSTFAGAALSMIQILLLVWSTFKYIKELRAKKNQVHPIPLSDLQSLSADPSLSPDRKEKFFEDKTMRMSIISLKSNSPFVPKIRDLSTDDKMFSSLRKLSPEFFEKWPQGKQRYEDLKGWWDSVCSEISLGTPEISPDTQKAFGKDDLERSSNLEKKFLH